MNQFTTAAIAVVLLLLTARQGVAQVQINSDKTGGPPSWTDMQIGTADDNQSFAAVTIAALGDCEYYVFWDQEGPSQTLRQARRIKKDDSSLKAAEKKILDTAVEDDRPVVVDFEEVDYSGDGHGDGIGIESITLQPGT